MKLSKASVAIAVTIACSFLATPSFADGQCSNASLRGAFGFYRAGSTPAGTLASIGLARFDGRGTFSVTQNISKNGAFQFDVQLDGTYLINPDCTGAAFLDGVEFARLIVTRAGLGFYIFSESAGNAVYGVGQAIAATD